MNVQHDPVMRPHDPEFRTRLDATVSRKRKIEMLLERSLASYRSDVHGALDLAREALEIARSIRFKPSIATALRCIGGFQYLLGGLAEALENLHAAADISEKIDDRPGLVRALQKISDVRVRQGELMEAYRVAVRCLSLCEHGVDAETLALVQASVGVLFDRLGEFDKALEYTQQSHAGYRSLDNRAAAGEALFHIGDIYRRFRDWETALPYYRESLTTAREVGDRYLEISILEVLATFHLEREEHEQALAMTGEMLTIADELDVAPQKVIALSLLTNVHISQNNLESALANSEKTMRLLRDGEVRELRAHASLVRGDILLRMSDPRRALGWLTKGLSAARRAGRVDLEPEALRLISAAHESLGDTSKAFEIFKEYAGTLRNLSTFRQQKALAEMKLRNDIQEAEKDRERHRRHAAELQREVEFKQRELVASALHLVQKNEAMEGLKSELLRIAATLPAGADSDLRGVVRRMEGYGDVDSGWVEFQGKFNAANPEFIHRLSGGFPALTPTELNVCALLKINLSSKDIANLLNIAPRSVDIYRSRIRKKLGLEAETNLTSFLSSF